MTGSSRPISGMTGSRLNDRIFGTVEKGHFASLSSKVFASFKSRVSKPFGEPTVDRSEKFSGLAPLPPRPSGEDCMPPCQSHESSQAAAINSHRASARGVAWKA